MLFVHQKKIFKSFNNAFININFIDLGFENKTYFEEVEKDSTEWNEIQAAMKEKTWDQRNTLEFCDDEWKDWEFKLTKLERIQNKHFFRRYYNRLKQCYKKYKDTEAVDIERTNLFHSTGKTDPKLILTGVEGMDRNFASDSNFFGPGIYFAMWMDYSHFNSRK